MQSKPTKEMALTTLEYRNLVNNGNGTYTIEWNHPTLGWLPFTADANDVEEHGRLIHAEIVANCDATTYEGAET